MEIDFLHSYVNLSSYHPIILSGLALGHRITKHAKYLTSSEWGCMLLFQFDSELADQYYLEHYADTNNTMYICTPKIPVRPDLRRKYAETHPNKYSMVMCYFYQLGYFKRLYQKYHWSYVFSSEFPVLGHVYHIVVVLICITGTFGEFRSNHSSHTDHYLPIPDCHTLLINLYRVASTMYDIIRS